MIIVRAKPGDAPVLTAVALAAKGHWGYPAAWLAQWEPMLRMTPAFIAAHDTYAARSAGESTEICGFCALIENGGELSLEHLWVRPEAMGEGVGHALFERAATRARERGFEKFCIEADPHAESFYRHLGARRTGTVESSIQGTRRELPLLEYAL